MLRILVVHILLGQFSAAMPPKMISPCREVDESITGAYVRMFNCIMVHDTTIIQTATLHVVEIPNSHFLALEDTIGLHNIAIACRRMGSVNVKGMRYNPSYASLPSHWDSASIQAG